MIRALGLLLAGLAASQTVAAEAGGRESAFRPAISVEHVYRQQLELYVAEEDDDSQAMMEAQDAE